MALGSRTVEMLGTHSLITHGPRVPALVEVGCGCVLSRVPCDLDPICILPIMHGILAMIAATDIEFCAMR